MTSLLILRIRQQRLKLSLVLSVAGRLADANIATAAANTGMNDAGG